MPKFSDDEIEQINKITHEKTRSDFWAFRVALDRGECWICKKELASFDEERPCIHWLLMPPGFSKKHFGKVYQDFSMDRIQAFLRWLANATAPFRDINDVAEDPGTSKPVAVTIKHRDLEWSFSASANCIAGNEDGHPPHYHFQMRKNGRPFIDYGEYHIPLPAYDLWVLAVLVPDKAAEWRQMAVDARDSRLVAGIHFPVDNSEGFNLGEKVAREIIQKKMLQPAIEPQP